MKLYYHPFSQHSRRARIVADELGVKLAMVPVDMSKGEHQTQEFLAMNPGGTVPVLVDADFVLPESHAIMKYLIAKRGGSLLYPTDPKQRAQIDRWLDWIHTRLNPPIEQVAIQVMFMGDNADHALVKAQRQLTERRLPVLDAALAKQQGLGGDATIADVAAATTLALHEMCGGDLAKYPAIGAWYDQLKSRPSFAATAPGA